MTDVPMFDIPRPCVRCGRPDTVTDPDLDVCAQCRHLDHRWSADGCKWCQDAATPRDAAFKGGTAAVDADPEFAHQCQRALAVARDAARYDGFTAADVRTLLDAWGVPITRPAAIGSVFTRAANAGVIRATGEFRVSPVKGQHGRPLRVWVAA
jgi:hypothetical protein